MVSRPLFVTPPAPDQAESYIDIQHKLLQLYHLSNTGICAKWVLQAQIAPNSTVKNAEVRWSVVIIDQVEFLKIVGIKLKDSYVCDLALYGASCDMLLTNNDNCGASSGRSEERKRLIIVSHPQLSPFNTPEQVAAVEKRSKRNSQGFPKPVSTNTMDLPKFTQRFLITKALTQDQVFQSIKDPLVEAIFRPSCCFAMGNVAVMQVDLLNFLLGTSAKNNVDTMVKKMRRAEAAVDVAPPMKMAKTASSCSSSVPSSGSASTAAFSCVLDVSSQAMSAEERAATNADYCILESNVTDDVVFLATCNYVIREMYWDSLGNSHLQQYYPEIYDAVETYYSEIQKCLGLMSQCLETVVQCQVDCELIANRTFQSIMQHLQCSMKPLASGAAKPATKRRVHKRNTLQPLTAPLSTPLQVVMQGFLQGTSVSISEQLIEDQHPLPLLNRKRPLSFEWDVSTESDDALLQEILDSNDFWNTSSMHVNDSCDAPLQQQQQQQQLHETQQKKPVDALSDCALLLADFEASYQREAQSDQYFVVSDAYEMDEHKAKSMSDYSFADDFFPIASLFRDQEFSDVASCGSPYSC